MKKRILLIFSSLFLSLVCVACSNKYTIDLVDVYDGAEIDLLNTQLRTYLNLENYEEQVKFLVENEGKKYGVEYHKFEWTGDGSEEYTLYFADNKDFENADTIRTRNTSYYSMKPFVPGTTYYWKVEGDATEISRSPIDCFRVKDAPVRIIALLGTSNVRDIGGWETEDGGQVAYEKIYRGSSLNSKEQQPLSEHDMNILKNELGIISEIDLRDISNNSHIGNCGQTFNMFGEGYPYIQAPFTGYSHLYPEFRHPFETGNRVYDNRTKNALQQIFALLANEDNYPVYFHCMLGDDRTASLAFLINGYLGVSYEDLTRDYEVTSFATGISRWRGSPDNFRDGVMQDDHLNYIGWGKMYEDMMKYYATDDGRLSSAIRNYLVNFCEIPEEELVNMYKIMIKED